jgi:hypothetical protein
MDNSIDKQVEALTGFKGAPRDQRHCITCDQPGHYYYECNGGQFMKDVLAFADSLRAAATVTERPNAG